jgi:hypothetical protein
MSSELEQQLQRVLARVEPDATATEQANAAALAALAGPGLRSRYRLALVAAALVGALVVTGVTLAASRTAREVVGITDTPPRATHPARLPHGPLPPGSGGFAAYGNGRLWLASPSLTISARPYSAAELSPGALNVAVGSGHQLVVRRLSDGGIAWSHPTAGRVVAAAWAPIGTEIAYVVESGKSAQLHVIEGDGDHDRLVAGSVSAVTPSWRADSLALAYVSAAGRVYVDNFFSQQTRALSRQQGCPSGRATQVSFAPRGTLLAASIGDGSLLVGDPNRRWTACSGVSGAFGPVPSPRLAWISGRTLVASVLDTVTRLEVRGRHVSGVASCRAPSGVTALTVSPDRRQISLGLWRGDRLQLVVATMPVAGDRDLRIVRALRSLPDPSAGYTLIWR